MSGRRTMRTPPPHLAEVWWPLDGVAPTNSLWHAEHEASGWWDPGDLHRTRLRHATRLADELLASLPQAAARAGGVLLELGCGPGTSLQELCGRWPGELHGWDPDPAQREAARTLAPEAVVHDGEGPPLGLADGSVDVVWAPRCFARDAFGWAALLGEAHRVLRPGGHLVAVLGGPGAWAWERGDEPWDEDATGLLVLALDRAAAAGGPIAFTSRWWLREHWGRGFDEVLLRQAGVAMLHPDQGFGLGVWRRRAGEALAANRFASLTPGDVREGRAFQRQLALARSEARARAERRAQVLAEAQARLAALGAPGAVDDDPRVRAATPEGAPA